MKRILPASVLGLALLVGCVSVDKPAREPAVGEWVALHADGVVAGIEIHRTRLGLGGLASAGGAAAPIRNIVASETDLSFIAPAFDASFVAIRDTAQDRWLGVWTKSGVATPVIFEHGKAPEQEPAASAYARPQRLVQLRDGRRMNLYCLGTGSPTVVLEYGAGGTSADWASVHSKLAAMTRVCAYDRAGHGFSDPGPLPRDASAVVSDLGAMLEAGGIAGPYVLVGHSLGSLHARLFANRYLSNVAGMVLVDPSGDFQNERIDKAVPKMASTRGNNDGLRQCIAAARKALVPRDSDTYRQCRQNDADMMESRLSEAESMQTTSSAETTATRRPYGDMPLIVLTRGDNGGAPPQLTEADIAAYYVVWQQMHDEFAALSSVGVRRVVAGAKHYIQNDKPEAVIGAVNEVVAEARRGRGG